MSNIEELRLRLEDAERRFGLKTADTNQYSVRLVRLVDAIVDDLWVQRRDNERLTFENEEFRSMRMGLIYEDECFLLSTSLARTTFEDRDVRPENSILFRIVFKTLGEIAPSTSVSSP